MSINLRELARATKATDKIITPRLQPWLIQHGDDPLTPEVADIVRNLLTTPPRARGASFSASSAGACDRRQVLAFIDAGQGVTDAQLANIFMDGKWRHLRWQAMLLTLGLLTDVEDPLIWKAQRSRGTMDGSGIVYDDHPRTTWQNVEFGFELKGVSTFQYGKYKADGPKEEHLNQVARYFLMSGFKLFVIVYEDKTTQAWHEWVMDAASEDMKRRVAEQREELLRLNKAVDNQRMPDMLPGCVTHKGPEWRDCPYGGASGACPKFRRWPKGL